MTALLEVDAVVREIESQSWAAIATTQPALNPCSAVPHFPMPLKPFVRPLEQLMDEFMPQPGALYQASSDWEQATGDVADVGQDLKHLRAQLDHLEGDLAYAVFATLDDLVDASHSVANWTKVVSQALQLCVTIFESVRIVACQALDLLSDYAGTLGEVLFGSWPWEFDKKAEAIHRFAQEVERFVVACSTLADQALQAGRDLVRLLTDLYRALIPFHQELEGALGDVIAKIPGGTPPDVLPGTPRGAAGDIYYPSKVPYLGSDLRFDKDYDYGYQHSYDLGTTHLSQEELMAVFQQNFGQLFLPSRVGDNTQLNMRLTHEGQFIETSLFGTAIPEVTTGLIQVQQITSDGFVITAMEGHPEFPGEVAFRLTVEDGRARLQVTGAYRDTILGRHDLGADVNTNPAYSAIANYSIWSDMQHRIQDKLQYG